MSVTKNTMLANERHLKERCESPKRVITNAQSALLLSAVSVPVSEILISYRVMICRWRLFRQDGIRPESSAGPSSLAHSRLLRSLRRDPCRLLLIGLSLRLLPRRRTSMVWAMVSRSRPAAAYRTPDTSDGNVVR